MVLKECNIAIILSDSTEKNTNNIMLEIGQMPIIFHIIKNISRLNFHKIIIAHDTTLTESDIEKITQFTFYDTKIIEFTLVDFNHNSEEITNKIFSKIPKNTNNIFLVSGNTPFVKTYSIFSALELLNIKNEFDETFPSLAILGIKYNKISNTIKSLFVEKKDEILDEKTSNITIHNPNVIFSHSKILETMMRSSIKKNDTVSINNIIMNAVNSGITISYIEADEEEILSINNNKKLIMAESIFQNKIRNKMINEGVKIISPETVFFTATTIVAPNAIIHPYVVLGQNVIIEQSAEIKSFSHIENSVIQKNSIIGPFARIRSGSTIKQYSKIGNFVEVKQSEIMENSSIAHLSYIGNAFIGSETNIGAGTIICNYNGFKKNETIIGDNCFIGSNTTIISPVSIGNYAFVAAGTTVTNSVPENSFTISRTKQKILKNKASKIKEKIKNAKNLGN